MDRTSFVILMTLEDIGATNELCCANVDDIVQSVDIGRARRTVCRKLSELMEEGYVLPGPPDGNARTYYITENAEAFLKNGGKEVEK